MDRKQQEYIKAMLYRFDGARQMLAKCNLEHDDYSFEEICITILSDIYELVLGDSE